MKILLTADPELPVPPRLYGGIQRIVAELVIRLEQRGHEVGLVAHPESTATGSAFFPWQGMASQARLDTLRNTLVLYRACRTFQPDILHSFSRLAYLLPLLPGELRKVMSYQRAPGARQIRLGVRLAGESIQFTGCSEHIRAAGASSGGTWHAIYNFVDTSQYTFQPTVAPDAPLVFLSRIERIKGAHTAIAFAKQAGRRLLIAGNKIDQGEGLEYWRTQIEPHLGKDSIEYIGPVDDRQKNELLGSAAAMIVPIEWEEPFGIVFVESLACGTPVITCRRGAAREIIRDGVEGVFIDSGVDANAALARLETIDRAGCRKRVEEAFSADVIVAQYETLYNSFPHKE